MKRFCLALCLLYSPLLAYAQDSAISVETTPRQGDVSASSISSLDRPWLPQGYRYPSFDVATSPTGSLSSVTTTQVRAWSPNSTKALLWALLPGGGQIYNRKYWKLPIVWGAIATSFYAVQWNQNMYRDYHAAYRDLSSEDPSKNTAWLDFAPRGAKPEDYEKYSSLKGTLKRGNDFYRRYRDISIVATVLVYGLSILDAYVDAELATFDISPDLTLRVQPDFALPSVHLPSYQMGLRCSLSF